MANESPFSENNSPDRPQSQPQLRIDPTTQAAQAQQPSYAQDFYQPQPDQTAQQPYQPAVDPNQPYQPQGQYQQQEQYQQPGAQQPYQQPYVQQRVFNQPANSRLLAMLMYWSGIIGLIMAVTVADRNDPFIRHHLNQMLVLFLGGIICGVVSCIPIIGLIGMAAGIAVLVFTIMATVDAYHGDIKPLPLIGTLQLIK